MGDDLRQDTPPPLPDLDGCRNELSRSTSSLSSLTVDNAKEDEIPDNCTAWTDKKHSLYLNHLESTFIEQLHCSMGLLAWCSKGNAKGPSLSGKLAANTQNTPEQKIDLTLDSTADSLVPRRRWIHQSRSAGRHCIVRSAYPQKYFVLPASGMHLKEKRSFSNDLVSIPEQSTMRLDCHEESADCIKEFSDQNFAVGPREEKSSMPMSKRSKTTMADSLGQDQIVPFENFHVTEISTLNHTSLEREEEFHEERIPEPDMNSCLRES